MKKAILLSGGMDSSCLAAWQKPSLAIYIDYGQNCANAEKTAAQNVSRELGLTLVTIAINCSSIGSGIMCQSEDIENEESSDWWPYRNQLIITMAASLALRHNCTHLLIGSVLEDQIYQDGTKAFYRAIDSLISLQEGGLRIISPAIDLTATELVKKSGLGLDILGWTHSCNKSNLSCGSCRGCYKRLKVMKDCGLYEK